MLGRRSEFHATDVPVDNDPLVDIDTTRYGIFSGLKSSFSQQPADVGFQSLFLRLAIENAAGLGE